MSFLNIFKKKKKKNADPEFTACDEQVMSELSENDFLGKAAEAGHKAKAAVKENQYDEAWGLYHEQKSFYMQHANCCGFTARQALALDASVHEDLANIMRLEQKNNDALVHIVYWVLTGADSPIKRHQQKLQSYFNRCKFKNTTLAEAQEELSSQEALPEFTLSKSVVSGWVDRG